MGRPRIMLDVGFFARKKVAALPWRRQLGFIYVLTRAKLQDREGVFASKPVLNVEAGVFRDGIADLTQSGLLHDSTALCDKCVAAFPDLEDGNVVVHDWHDYQVSRTTAWRIDKGRDGDDGETAVKQPRNIGAPDVQHPSRARVTRFPVLSSETRDDGGSGGVEPDEAALFSYLARHGAAIRPESGFGRRLLGLIERRGAMLVMAKAIVLAASGPLSDRQWVFGLEQALEDIPDPKVAERAQDAEKRAAKRDQGVWQRRIEAYRNGGAWDPAWGDPPMSA